MCLEKTVGVLGGALLRPLLLICLLFAPCLVAQPIATAPDGISIDKKEIELYFSGITPGVTAASMATPPNIESAISNLYSLQVMAGRGRDEGLLTEAQMAWLASQAVDRDLSQRWLRGEIERRVVDIDWEPLAREQYLAKADEFYEPEKLVVRHIILLTGERRLVDVVNELDALRERIISGEDFAVIAEQYSQDGSAIKGGSLGEIGEGESVPAFERVIFDLEVGQLSEVFLSPYGAHIALVEAKVEAKKLPYEQVRERLISGVQASRVADIRSSILAAIKAELTREEAVIDRDLIEAMRSAASREVSTE